MPWITPKDLLSSRASIGYVTIAKNKLATNQGFKSFIVKDDEVNNEFLIIG